MLETNLKETLAELSERGLKRKMRTIEGSQSREITLDGRKVLNFCSNNYLGLADDPRLGAAAAASITAEGFGSGASRLVCGNLSSHSRLEEKIAEFKGTERALLFSTGYMANLGIISSLYNRGDMIFSDKLNHASILDGILLSGAEYKRYAHVDMESLEAMLKAAPPLVKKLIITDSVFSMDGDIAPLPAIVALAKKYNASVMVDEAHGLGVLGKNGKGAVEHFGLEGQVDIQMGTFSKAAGSFGAYCCGSNQLIDLLINKARSFIYTTGLPPSVAAASIQGLEIIAQEPQRRTKLWKNTEFLLKALKDMGFDTLNTQTSIIPILVKDAPLSVRFSERLLEDGIFVSAIRPPTVPANTARLRVTVMATHTEQDLNKLLSSMKKIGKELCLI
ncbi:MAG: 8-amino-7-oxononanoate synthase [Candidatus Omnitrophica bacterium]|nr:8-amino-7-oxononanoate synthase [Candidatus Omnitrophota bacterium]